MPGYYQPSNKHKTTIGPYTFTVDSDLEEHIIRALEQNGFADRWRPATSIQNWGHRYTPDLELSIQEGGLTHLALVEIKPSLGHFNDTIAKRMIGARKFYTSAKLLIYSDKNAQWYELLPKGRNIMPITPPQPGTLPIKHLYTPSLTQHASSVFNKQYPKKFRFSELFMKAFIALLTAIVKPFQSRPKRRRRHK